MTGLAPLAAVFLAAAPFDAGTAVDEFEREFRLYYAYLDRDVVDLDDWFASLRGTAQGMDASEVRTLLLRATYALADPHVAVVPRTDDDLNVWPTSGDLAVGVEGDRFVVLDVRQGGAADAAGVRPGWELTTVDGAAVSERVTALFAGIVATPNDVQRGYAATLSANGPRTGARSLGFVTPDGPRTVALANARDYANAVSERAPVTVTHLDEACVLRVENSLGDDATVQAFDAAIAACDRPAMVLDLRNTPSGGNTVIGRSILGHFITEEAPYQVHTIPAIERRTSVPRKFVEMVLPRAPHFAGPVAVLGSRWTGSMGEGLVVGMHALGARTFASDLGDLLGAVHGVELPMIDATLRLGAEGLFHVNGTPRGDFVADVALSSADRDAQGGDPAMEAALAWLRGAGAGAD